MAKAGSAARTAAKSARKQSAVRAPGGVRRASPGAGAVALRRPGPATKAADAALARYLDPAFYERVASREWIGELARSDATVRMDLVRQGIPARAVAALAEALDMSRDELTRELDLPRATVERKLREGGRLAQAESERVLGVATLVAQVERIVAESGDPAGFDAALWVAHWLRTPAPALGGRPPIAFMDTADGRAVVSQLVAQMQSGAYA